MSGKSDKFSEKQARGKAQSDCKLLGARRSPFADITNTLNSRPGRRDELSSPPLLSRTLKEAEMQNENVFGISDSGGARNCCPAGPLKNRRAVRLSPPLVTSHTGLPSSLEDIRSSSPVKSVPAVPFVTPLGSVLHPNGDSLRSRPRRQLSLGSGALNQYPHVPGLCGEPAVNDVLHYDAPNLKPPLSSYSGPSTREPLSTSLLPPKTHKLACGQLAILPSHSVLVDLREGERRKGRKGEEVMVVSPNGDQVGVCSNFKELDSEISRLIYSVLLT